MSIQNTHKIDIQEPITEIAKAGMTNSIVDPVVVLRVHENEHEMESIIARIQVCSTILLHFRHLQQFV